MGAALIGQATISNLRRAARNIDHVMPRLSGIPSKNSPDVKDILQWKGLSHEISSDLLSQAVCLTRNTLSSKTCNWHHERPTIRHRPGAGRDGTLKHVHAFSIGI
jgi:hypothetical protein